MITVTKMMLRKNQERHDLPGGGYFTKVNFKDSLDK